MTVSTDGQICYGIYLSQDTTLPWHDERYENDPDEWWLTVAGFTPTKEVYQNNKRISGVTEEEIDRYFTERNAFLKATPCPFADVNYCSMSAPMYILALSSKILTAKRGYPESFDPADLTATSEDDAKLLAFCEEYDIEIGDEKPRWWLSSYWER